MNFSILDLNLRQTAGGDNPMKLINKKIKKNTAKRPTISGVTLPKNEGAQVQLGLEKKIVDSTTSIFFKPKEDGESKLPEYIK